MIIGIIDRPRPAETIPRTISTLLNSICALGVIPASSMRLLNICLEDPWAVRTARIPSMVFDVLRNLVKGRMKINLELTGYDELLQDVNNIVFNVVLAVFACVLFTGSCILCTTDIEPKAGSMPLMSLIGFVVSVALGIYAIKNMTRKK